MDDNELNQEWGVLQFLTDDTKQQDVTKRLSCTDQS